MPLRPISSTLGEPASVADVPCRPRRSCRPVPLRQAQAGGEGRIRTSEGARPTDLQSVAFDRSATSPNMLVRSHLHYAILHGAHTLMSLTRLACRRLRPRDTSADVAAAPGTRGTLPGGTGWRTRDHQHTGPACPEKRRRGLPRPTARGHSSVTCRCFPWSWRRDLNPRPADYKSAALPD
jgi:hypothetical protein